MAPFMYNMGDDHHKRMHACDESRRTHVDDILRRCVLCEASKIDYGEETIVDEGPGLDVARASGVLVAYAGALRCAREMHDDECTYTEVRASFECMAKVYLNWCENAVRGDGECSDWNAVVVQAMIAKDDDDVDALARRTWRFMGGVTHTYKGVAYTREVFVNELMIRYDYVSAAETRYGCTYMFTLLRYLRLFTRTPPVLAYDPCSKRIVRTPVPPPRTRRRYPRRRSAHTRSADI